MALSQTQLMLTKIAKLIVEIRNIKREGKANKLLNKHRLSKSMEATHTRTPESQNTDDVHDLHDVYSAYSTPSHQTHPIDNTYTPHACEEHPIQTPPILTPPGPNLSHTSLPPPSASSKSSSSLVCSSRRGGTSDESEEEEMRGPSASWMRTDLEWMEERGEVMGGELLDPS